jgi:dolichyl-phosphate-mannose-protein mannosyltransferase
MSRDHTLALAAITAVGIALRWRGVGDLSLNHFDEGVLVSGAFDVWLKGPWSFTLAQPLQAPPLFPWLVTALMWLTGTTWPIMGIYASALLGSMTIPLFFFLARRPLGNRLGLVAAGLLAASDLHVAFSRMALTEASLTFAFVLAMYCWVRLFESAGRATTDAGRPTRQRPPRRLPTVQPPVVAWPTVSWAIAAGLATGAAWNIKYNGWLPLAIAGTGWLLAALRHWLSKTFLARHSSHAAHLTPSALRHALSLPLAWTAATALAGICFLPWYRFVENNFAGGYGAVTHNHLAYVGGWSDWPDRAWRVLTSLAAFRQFGWLLTLAAAVSCLIYLAARARRVGRSAGRSFNVRRMVWAASLAAAWPAALAMGTDFVWLLLAAAAIVPVLVWGETTEVVLAVWAGAFLVTVPFYHPYTRLVVPALPAALCLSLWLLRAAWRPAAERNQGSADVVAVGGSARPLAARATLSAAAMGMLAMALFSHPFGWLPDAAAWQRQSSRQSYRALGDAVLAQTPKNALVICQGLPVMPLYVEREWIPLETQPFTDWLARVSPDRPCYLAVDFWGIYGEGHTAVRAAIDRHTDCLTPVAIVPNDLNLVTLLDYLPAAAVARHISERWPLERRGTTSGQVAVPARLGSDHAGIIVLYQIGRECVAARSE